VEDKVKRIEALEKSILGAQASAGAGGPPKINIVGAPD
jgi:hypothetical protein